MLDDGIKIWDVMKKFGGGGRELRVITEVLVITARGREKEVRDFTFQMRGKRRVGGWGYEGEGGRVRSHGFIKTRQALFLGVSEGKSYGTHASTRTYRCK